MGLFNESERKSWVVWSWLWDPTDPADDLRHIVRVQTTGQDDPWCKPSGNQVPVEAATSSARDCGIVSIQEQTTHVPILLYHRPQVGLGLHAHGLDLGSVESIIVGWWLVTMELQQVERNPREHRAYQVGLRIHEKPTLVTRGDSAAANARACLISTARGLGA